MSGGGQLEIATSHALLLRVARGELPSLVRVYRPSPTLAFGRLDRLSEGYPDAVEEARSHGFGPVLRLAGGHAAAYHRSSLVCEEVVSEPSGFRAVAARRNAFASRLRDTLTAVGADAAIGELPGEYCPGSGSINVGGRVKVAGVAQRVILGASLTSAAVVVGEGAAVRAVLDAVYRALGVEFDPATAGALEDELREIGVEAVEAELLNRFRRELTIDGASLDTETEALAQQLLGRHEAGV